MDSLPATSVSARAWQEKVAGKVLQFGNSGQQKLAWKQKRRKSPKSVPALPLDPSGLEFSQFLPLHSLWKSYIDKLLGIDPKAAASNPKTAASVLPLLARADLHGCIVKVVRSKMPSLVGFEGIILKENRWDFEILSQRTGLKSMPSPSYPHM